MDELYVSLNTSVPKSRKLWRASNQVAVPVVTPGPHQLRGARTCRGWYGVCLAPWTFSLATARTRPWRGHRRHNPRRSSSVDHV